MPIVGLVDLGIWGGSMTGDSCLVTISESRRMPRSACRTSGRRSAERVSVFFGIAAIAVGMVLLRA